MKADDAKPTPTVSTNPITGSTITPPPDHQHTHAPHRGSGDEVVAEGIAEFWGGVKHWLVRNSRAIGIILAIVLLIGLWKFWSGQSKQGTSRLWAALEQTTDPDALKTFADANADTTAGKIARMELARSQLGPNGIALLTIRNAEERTKGIDNIEQARSTFLKLSQEFPKDVTMQCEALKLAAEAELALVGIPKADKPMEFRGSVTDAVALYEKLAAVVGESTPVGEWAKKRATELKANEQQVVALATELNRRMKPPEKFDIKMPPGLTPSTSTGTPPILPSEPIVVPTKPLTPPETKPTAATTPETKPANPETKPTPPTEKK